MGNKRIIDNLSSKAEKELNQLTGRRKLSWVWFFVMLAVYLMGMLLTMRTSSSEDVVFFHGNAIPLRALTGAFSGLNNLCIVFLVVFFGKTGFYVSLLTLVLQFPMLLKGLFVDHVFTNIAGVVSNLLMILTMYLIYHNSIKAEEYQVRYAADRNHEASAAVTLTVQPGPYGTVTFVTDHGQAPETITGLSYGDSITRPAGFLCSGWSFLGWYKDEACSEKWDFAADMVTGDMTLYAGWEKAEDPPADPPETDPAPADPSGTWTAPEGSRYSVSGDSATFLSPDPSATNVTIPSAITVDGKSVKVTAIADKAFYRNKKLKSVTIGKYVQTIGKSAFEGCVKLKTVKGGAGLVTIKDKAFKGCKVLAAFTFNTKVTKIGKSAYEGCKKLKTITFKTAKLKKAGIGKNSFKGIYAKPTVKCPKKQLKDYKSWLLKTGKMPSKAKFK